MVGVCHQYKEWGIPYVQRHKDIQDILKSEKVPESGKRFILFVYNYLLYPYTI